MFLVIILIMVGLGNIVAISPSWPIREVDKYHPGNPLLLSLRDVEKRHPNILNKLKGSLLLEEKMHKGYVSSFDDIAAVLEKDVSEFRAIFSRQSPRQLLSKRF